MTAIRSRALTLSALAVALALMLAFVGVSSAYATEAEEGAEALAAQQTEGQPTDQEGQQPADESEQPAQAAEDPQPEPQLQAAEEDDSDSVPAKTPKTTTSPVYGIDAPATLAGWITGSASGTPKEYDYFGSGFVSFEDGNGGVEAYFIGEDWVSCMNVKATYTEGDKALYTIPVTSYNLYIQKGTQTSKYYASQPVVKGTAPDKDYVTFKHAADVAGTPGLAQNAAYADIDNYEFEGFFAAPFTKGTTPDAYTFWAISSRTDIYAHYKLKPDAKVEDLVTPIDVEGTTGISASATLPEELEDAGLKIEAAPVTSGDDYATLIAETETGKTTMFKVTMKDAEGNEVHSGFGKLTLSFPVGNAFNGHYVTVYHLHADGTVTKERVIAVNGAASITVTDLSTFAVEIGELAPVESEEQPAKESTEATTKATAQSTLPKTGDPLQAAGLVSLGAVALATMFLARRKQLG